VKVSETFFSVAVRDMQRATEFYVGAFEARVSFASPQWSSLQVANVRIGLALTPGHDIARMGLHFATDDLEVARRDIERAGGRMAPPVEVAPGVLLTEAIDTEGNTFTVAKR
jgi:predicted enzyme related to lactoylglutathione lyase